VTVAVTPDQAKALKVVEGRGEMSLALRGENDFENLASFASHHADKMTLDQLLGMPNMTRRTQMEVYRGAKRDILEFNERVPASAYNNLISTPIAAEVPFFQGPNPDLTPRTIESGAEAGGAESGAEAAGSGS
jgi:hypothetical protein